MPPVPTETVSTSTIESLRPIDYSSGVMSAARQIHPATSLKGCTFNEYLLWEEAQEERHEYLNGEVVAMAGASENHEIVAGNVFAEILMHLRGKGCRVFKGDMKLRFQAGSVDLSYYPDVMVVCDPADEHPPTRNGRG